MYNFPFSMSSQYIVILIILIILTIIFINKKKTETKNKPFNDNISSLTIENMNYRNVINSTNNMQIILMSLLPGQEIGLKNYKNNTQIIRNEQGNGLIMINGKYFNSKEGDITVIPSDTIHNIKNISSFERLQLYIISTSTDFPPKTIQKTKPKNE